MSQFQSRGYVKTKRQTRYVGWAVLTAGRGVNEKIVAYAQSRDEARQLVREMNRTSSCLHWCEWWDTTSILSSTAGGVRCFRSLVSS